MALFVVVAACGPEAHEARPPLVTASASSTAPIPPPPAPREDGRLPAIARPLRYALRLEIDPRKETFSGSEDILLDLAEPTVHVVLSSFDAIVKSATFKVGGETFPLRASTRPSHGALESREFVLLADGVVSKGRATFSIA